MGSISEEEKLGRCQSNESALGTLAMEGLFPDEPTLALLRDYEEGALTLEQFSSAMDGHALRLLATRAKIVGAA